MSSVVQLSCAFVLLLAILNQVVHCSIHGLSSPSSHLHSLSAHTQRRHSSSSSDDEPYYGDDDRTNDREAAGDPSLSSSGSGQCLADNFHYPHHCAVPDCAFMVAWRERDAETIIFNLTAKVMDSKMVWAAVGFSDNAKMQHSDGVICYVKEDGEPEVHLGLIQPSLKRTVKIQDNVENALGDTVVQIKDGKLYCSFSRKKNISDSVVKWKSLSSSWHILVAMGALEKVRNENTTMILPHTKKAASNCKCNVSSCTEKCDCPDGFRYQLLKLHGVLMTVAFIFFIPTGALVSRYYKMVFSSSWFKGHIAMMVIGILWALIGFGMVLGHTGGVFSIGLHQLVGIACLSMIVVQPIVGFLRPPVEKTIRRVIFVAFHKSVAILILLCSCVALFMGTYIFCNPVMVWTMAILGVSILTNLGFILLLEILTKTHKFSTAPPVGYHKVTKNDDLSESEEEVFVRDDPNKKTKSNGSSGGVGSSGSGKKSSHQQSFTMEKTLLVIYVVQAFGFAVLVASLLYYFDSHKHGD